MEAKINERLLSIPPYISTTWSQIAALRMKGNLLAVTLIDGEVINVANLCSEQIDQIFSFHAAFLEQETLMQPRNTTSFPLNRSKENPSSPLPETTTTFSFAFGALDGFNSIIQHNPEQAHSPDLPLEVLNKISEIARVIFCLDDIQMPKAEPHCNCFHCQIARVLNPSNLETINHEREESFEDEVSAEELQFEEWSITQTGEQLYLVKNRLDELEKYNVFLGCPVGCTCGKVNCEHILAVLKS